MKKLTTFGDWMRSARGALGLTLEDLAERAGTTKGYVWDLENGKSTPTLETANKICEAVGTKLWKVLKLIDK